MQKFVKSSLNDVSALEYMLQNEWFESDVVRIGAEQEMVMVDNTTFKPSLVANGVIGTHARLPLGGNRIGKV